MNEKEEKIETEYKEAWEKLIELAGGVMKAQQVLRPLRERWINEVPHVKVANYKDGEPDYYNSTLEGFPSMGFINELEVNLANAMFLLAKSQDKHEHDRLQMVFRVALTLLDIESDWRY